MAISRTDLNGNQYNENGVLVGGPQFVQQQILETLKSNNTQNVPQYSVEDQMKINKQQADLAREKMLQEARLKDIQDQASGMKLQYSPVQATYVDANGNPVDKYTPGAIEKVALRDEYKLPGADNYIQQALLKQGLEEKTGKDNAALTSAQGQAQAQSQLAMRGGLRGGARTSLAKSGMRDMLLAQQNVGNQAALNRANIGLQGEQMNRETGKYNLETLLKGAGAENQMALEKYKKEMEVKAANTQAAATRDAGGSGGKK